MELGCAYGLGGEAVDMQMMPSALVLSYRETAKAQTLPSEVQCGVHGLSDCSLVLFRVTCVVRPALAVDSYRGRERDGTLWVQERARH